MDGYIDRSEPPDPDRRIDIRPFCHFSVAMKKSRVKLIGWFPTVILLRNVFGFSGIRSEIQGYELNGRSITSCP
jgi:hypothetical protein